MAGAARLLARLPARRRPPRLARLAAPPRAWPFTRALIDAGVTPDFRGPDSIRLGVAPLYTSFTEVWDALDRLRAIASAASDRGPSTRFARPRSSDLGAYLP